jgi:hypothetical protein
MTDEISAKNTKNEILDAYHEVLQKFKEVKKVTKQEQRITEEKKEIVEIASKQTTDDIVKNLAELKLSLVKSLEEIEEKLLSNHKQLTTLQQAIQIQTKDLAEIHEIKVNADTLSALLVAQREKSTAFEKEMKDRQQSFDQEIIQKRVLWKKEQDEFELARKEQEAQAKKTRLREEEEYTYQRDLLRQKERDQYEAEKQSLEKELTIKRIGLEKEFEEREAKIASQEQEFKLLKEKAEKFPAELQKAVQETDKSVTERLKFKYDYETKLAQKEVEGEKKLYQQMIAALEAKVAHLEAQAKHLSDKTNQANLQVQDIAVKAIEGASRQRYMGNYVEKTLEQTKPQ